MLVYEIYLFLFTTIVLVWIVFYKFFLWLFYPVLWIFESVKKWYYKVTSLNKIKEQVLDGNIKSDIHLENKEKVKNAEKLKSKLSRLFLQVEVFKQKWDLELLEQKLVEILSIDENNQKALEMLSNLYINLWKEKKAFPLLKKLIQVDMENDNAIWNLAKIYLDLWEINTAEILIKKAISLNNKNYRYYVTYADILYNQWKLEDAIDTIKRVLQLRPNNVIYMDALATLYEELGEYKKAKALWLEILELEPEYEKAKKKIK